VSVNDVGGTLEKTILVFSPVPNYFEHEPGFTLMLNISITTMKVSLGTALSFPSSLVMFVPSTAIPSPSTE
jgi:hypothetical protein